MFVKELRNEFFLFLCQSFIVAVFHGTDCPVGDVVSAKTFEMPVLAANTQFLFHLVYILVMQTVDLVLLLFDITLIAQAALFHGEVFFCLCLIPTIELAYIIGQQYFIAGKVIVLVIKRVHVILHVFTILGDAFLDVFKFDVEIQDELFSGNVIIET